MNNNLKKQILDLRNNGLTYNKIAEELKCSRSAVVYHLCEKARKSASKRIKKFRDKKPLSVKINRFINISYKKIIYNDNIKNIKIDKKLSMKISSFSRNNKGQRMFTVEDLKNKIGNNPKCYLTGRDIDLSKPRTYHLDHIIPSSKGGDNSLENCGLACKEANFAKSNMTLDEFKEICQDVVNNFYKH